MKSKKKQPSNLFLKIKERWILILFAGIVFYFSGLFLKGIVYKSLLRSNSIEETAIVINEKNYWGNNPVSQRFSYSYEYTVDNKVYRVDSRNVKLEVGDSVLIRYSPIFPKISKLINND